MSWKEGFRRGSKRECGGEVHLGCGGTANIDAGMVRTRTLRRGIRRTYGSNV